MKVKHIYSLTVLICVLSATGCSTESTTSDVVKTEGIWADIRLTSDGDRSRVVTEFNVNRSTGANIVLSDNDKVQATVGNETKVLEMDEDFFDIDYQGYFSQTSQGIEFKLELMRDKENETLTSVVNLPSKVTLYAPVTSTFKLQEQILIEWKAASEPNTILELDFSSTCTSNTNDPFSFGYNVKLDDSKGQYNLELSDVAWFEDETIDKSKPCKSYVTLSRKRNGTIDSRFKSGSTIYAIQRTQSEKFSVTLN
ncbi:hypothetical protein [Pseudoalteromonas piscicida]|uniref:hypothetical protein n=1 Tax=Pseudoalteromonas piscicida TaxID=43662 RepID=UPI00309E66FE